MQTYTTPTGTGPASGDTSRTEQAKEQAQQAAGQAKGRLRDQVDQRSTEAGERVGTFASDVRSVGDQLREQGKEQPAKLADQAAQRAEQVGDYLKHNDADRILGDVEDFGRRQPWVVVAGGIVLGVAASRFLKASSSRRYEQRQGSSPQLPARTQDVTPTTPPVPVASSTVPRFEQTAG